MPPDAASPDLAALADVVARRYAIATPSLEPLLGGGRAGIYRVVGAGGHARVLRTYPAGDAADDGVADHAAMLLFLEEYGYPAARLVRARDGAAVIAAGGRRFLLTTFVAGDDLDYSPPGLRALGAALGRLHTLPLPHGGAASLPRAAMRPAREIPWALSQLARVAARVPPDFRRRYDELRAALHAVPGCEDLPRSVIHNDCHPGNAVRTPDGRAVLIDWDGAGVGPAVLDLGFLITSCATESPWTPPLHPDPGRVEAVLDGYCRHRIPGPAELDRLADAMRFRALVYGACNVAEAIDLGHLDAERAAGWWRARVDAADALAARTRARIASHSGHATAPSEYH